VGTVAVALAGLALMAIRRRSLRRLAAFVLGALIERRLPSLLEQGVGAIPAEAEMPAAAVLAVCGLALEGLRLWLSLR
jgi:Na+-transporting NADH:ubiquinone oxidoreductase subunit NqrB